MLSQLYKFGKIGYVGGGFGKGIHNILEAAVYGTPVLFGPNHSRSMEAKELIDVGGAFEINTKEQLKEKVMTLLNDHSTYELSAAASKKYVEGKTGATGIIYNYIALNRLLTN
jgi:3-deoxy-D-manno-octulosonic-acid transferase